jgi:hypothetical protein
LHPVPSATTGFEQAPLVGSQIPGPWHWSAAAQVTGAPGAQLPPWQVSPTVQALPSSQAVPSALLGFEQTPLEGSQVPAA